MGKEGSGKGEQIPPRKNKYKKNTQKANTASSGAPREDWEGKQSRRDSKRSVWEKQAGDRTGAKHESLERCMGRPARHVKFACACSVGGLPVAWSVLCVVSCAWPKADGQQKCCLLFPPNSPGRSRQRPGAGSPPRARSEWPPVASRCAGCLCKVGSGRGGADPQGTRYAGRAVGA